LQTKSKRLKSILLVDDDQANNFLNKIFIDHLQLDIEVDIALNGKEAITHINTSLIAPCLLILDLSMPVMDGWAFLEVYDTFAQKIKDSVVIVILTISTEQEAQAKAKKNPNVVEFIQKPLSDVKFSNLIKRHFHQS